MRRLLASMLAVLIGWLLARPFHISAVSTNSWYIQFALVLLAVGLFSSTHSISLNDAKRHWRLVLLAITIGVAAKAALIATVMIAAFGRPEFLVLGIAVAQIDPLSVAAQTSDTRMSPRAKTILYAWASFDDPVTVLLTVYLTAIVLHTNSAGSLPGQAGAFLLGLAPNLIVVVLAGCWALWRWPDWQHRKALRPAAESAAPPAPVPPAPPVPLAAAVRPAAVAAAAPYAGRPGTACAATATLPPEPARVAATPWRRDVLDWADVGVLVVLLVAGAHYSLLLGVAVSGLFFRPAAFDSLDRVTQVAFYLAAGTLGFVLVHGLSLVPALVLGVTAFAAQGVVAGVLTARLPDWHDRRHLMLAQQNGITAIVLAVILEPDFSGTVGIVAPAVLVINVLYYATNRLFDRDRTGSLTAARR